MLASLLWWLVGFVCLAIIINGIWLAKLIIERLTRQRGPSLAIELEKLARTSSNEFLNEGTENARLVFALHADSFHWDSLKVVDEAPQPSSVVRRNVRDIARPPLRLVKGYLRQTRASAGLNKARVQ